MTVAVLTSVAACSSATLQAPLSHLSGPDHLAEHLVKVGSGVKQSERSGSRRPSVTNLDVLEELLHRRRSELRIVRDGIDRGLRGRWTERRPEHQG
nr:hypothetical protein [Actinomycetes bacterium]